MGPFGVEVHRAQLGQRTAGSVLPDPRCWLRAADAILKSGSDPERNQ